MSTQKQIWDEIEAYLSSGKFIKDLYFFLIAVSFKSLGVLIFFFTGFKQKYFKWL